MTGWLGDWANLLLRWTHFIAGIAWIGSSFYFLWLDRALAPPAQSRARGGWPRLWLRAARPPQRRPRRPAAGGGRACGACPRRSFTAGKTPPFGPPPTDRL